MVDRNYITAKEVDDAKEKRSSNQRTSTFDRIRLLVAQTIVFERLSMIEVYGESMTSD